jgi:hypothetical protein
MFAPKNIATGFEPAQAAKIAAAWNAELEDDDWKAVVRSAEGARFVRVEIVEKDGGDHVAWIDCETGAMALNS